MPIALIVCLIPYSQRVVLFSLDFNMLRVALTLGLLRLLLKPSEVPAKFSTLDKVFLYWSLAGSIVYVLGQPSISSVVYKLGLSFELLGFYLLCRSMLPDMDHAAHFLSRFAIVTTFIAIGVIVELNTRYNIFSILGGVPETTWMRDGRLRCQAAFSHPIMAGVYGATSLPLFIGLFFYDRKHRLLAFLGSISSTIIVGGSASSGPLFAVIAAGVALSLWLIRRRMRLFRWCLFAGLLFLHLIREQPVWHLIGRASDLVGGTGYHRVALINAFVDRFAEWMLVGSTNVAYWGWGLQDVTNQYVLEGVRGGLVSLILLIAILVYCYKRVGSYLNSKTSKSNDFWVWCIGACVTSHTVSFIGVSYFGQLNSIFALHIAIVASLPLASSLAKSRPASMVKTNHPEFMVLR